MISKISELTPKVLNSPIEINKIKIKFEKITRVGLTKLRVNLSTLFKISEISELLFSVTKKING